jgi:hypothetical protein
MSTLKPYVILFRANGLNQEWIRFHESITEAVENTRKAIRKEFGDHKIQMVTELSDQEFQELLKPE